MKTKFFLYAIVLLCALPALIFSATTEIVYGSVDGFTCQFCAYGVQKQLQKVPGVKSVTVSIKTGSVRIIMQSGVPANLKQIKTAIVNAGYSPKKFETKTVQSIE